MATDRIDAMIIDQGEKYLQSTCAPSTHNATHTAVASDGDSSINQRPASIRGPLCLMLCVITILSVWGWALPTIGNAPTIRRSIENTQRMGINPAAIFYTDVYEKTNTPEPFGITQ